MTTLVKDKLSPAIGKLKEEFSILLRDTFAAEPEWLKDRRSRAFDKFLQAGIPARKNEEYKYSDVHKIFSKPFTAVHNELHTLPLSIKELAIDSNSVKLIFINGWLYKDSTLSAILPEGVIVGSMAAEGVMLKNELLEKFLGTAPAEKQPFSELNSALWFDGAFVYIPADTRLEQTIEIIHIFTGNRELMVSPRSLIIAGKNAELGILEQNISLQPEKQIIANAVTEIYAAENSHVNYYKLQRGNRNTFQIHNTFAVQQQDSVFDTFTVTLESDWIRNNLHIALNAPNSEAHLNGVFLTGGDEHVDNHTTVQHNMPHCQSNQLYKGILDGRSTGVFNGRIFVARDAQKTNAYQSSKSILLSNDAAIHTKPQLEIYADDVKCSHGSSTGKLNDEALFYLRSRGMGEGTARKLLLLAFVNDVLEKIRMEPLKIHLEEYIRKKLSD